MLLILLNSRLKCSVSILHPTPHHIPSFHPLILKPTCDLLLDASHQLRLKSGALIACPIPEEFEVDGLVIQKAVDQAVAESEQNGVSKRGKEATPWLLKRVMELTKGDSLKNSEYIISPFVSMTCL